MKKTPKPRPAKHVPLHCMREWRQHRNMTIAKFAEAMGMSDAAISMLETGKQSITHPTMLAAIEVFQIRAAELFMKPNSNEHKLWTELVNLPAQSQPIALQLIRTVAGGISALATEDDADLDHPNPAPESRDAARLPAPGARAQPQLPGPRLPRK